MNDLLFATPWWLPTCIIGVGIILFISGNKRQQPRVRASGLAVVALAILLMVVSYLVETDKEKVVRHTHELVTAVENSNWDKMRSLLSNQVSLGTINGTIYPNRDVLLKGAADAVEDYKLKSVIITSLEIQQTQTLITANMNLFTFQDKTEGRPLPSGWQLEWEQSGNDWLLSRITCVSVGNQSVNTIHSLFPR
jgi:hypothetical protein